MILQCDIIHLCIKIFINITGLIISCRFATIMLIGAITACIYHIDYMIIIEIILKCSSEIVIPILTA